MFTAAKLFLGTDTGKMLMMGLLIGVLLIGSYTMGRSHGHTSGYTEGFKAGQLSKAEEITNLKADRDALTKIINTERKAVADKVKEVEKTAAEASIKTQERLGKEIRARDKVIADYNKVVPVSVQEQCGLSVETVKAINKLIDIANGGQNEVGESSRDTSGSLDANSGSSLRQQSEEGTPERRSIGTQDRDREHPAEATGALQEAAEDGRTSAFRKGNIRVHQYGDYTSV